MWQGVKAQEVVIGAIITMIKLSRCNHAPGLMCICISHNVHLNHRRPQNNLEYSLHFVEGIAVSIG